jgi:hypothetical protein
MLALTEPTLPFAQSGVVVWGWWRAAAKSKIYFCTISVHSPIRVRSEVRHAEVMDDIEIDRLRKEICRSYNSSRASCGRCWPIAATTGTGTAQ